MKKSSAAHRGTEYIGSSPNSAHSQNAAYMLIIMNSPWAKLTISMSPKIRLKPAAMRA